MIVHQDVGIQEDAGRAHAITKLPEEAEAVVVGPEDVRAPVPAGTGVVEGVGEADSRRSRYGDILIESAATVKLILKV